MRRRTFIQTAAALSATAAAQGQSTAPIRLGFDTYSVRAFQWKAIQLLDYAARLKLDTIQISALADYESLEPGHLALVKDHAAKLGIAIDGGMGCICPLSKSWTAKNGDPRENILKGLRVAKAVGASSMRCFMGKAEDRLGKQPIEALMDNTIGLFRSVRSETQDLGVKIALENHAGDMQAQEVRTIIEQAGKDYVASCLDTGNPMWVVEDPMVSLEVLAPYVVTTHVRDSVVYEHPRGAAAQWVALGDGIIDFHKFVARYRELCPKASMQLEIITGRPPQVLPYLEPDFWKAFPKAKASEFARFVALARHGHPFTGFMVVEDGVKEPLPEFKAALREQQRVDLERSLEYAKKSLGVGVSWRS
ncbi:MAG TPA: sugar phosphate isomerase/epimerase [Bryobacteraceae bacterium]|nr:sugar phosphate isomerase/epimerase [Bryobacteraceae bacterium]